MTGHHRLYKEISGACSKTPDPDRAKKNTERFFEAISDGSQFLPHLSLIARLFACSQFLANYSINNPEELLDAIREVRQPLTRSLIHDRVERELQVEDTTDINEIMKRSRYFKKKYLLRITLRDLAGETDIISSMDELTFLAESIINAALRWCLQFSVSRYGSPGDRHIALIGVGKLGGEELNYSSDVDLMAVYDEGEGETSGIPNPSGIIFNRIGIHEFFCRTVELLNKVLSTQTEDGIAYRVDMRLRPQGQKGSIAMPLASYRTYYESWGRTWERMMLIRARPVAGDEGLGRDFIAAVDPFVWRSTLDYAEIEEIRGLKKKIDSTFTRDDIKRGYGGIREAEFFIHTFQLLYAGQDRALKSYRILNAAQTLKWMKIIPEKDLMTLLQNYLYLRRIEHYLQMRDDLQTHTLPSSDHDIECLARMMGFDSGEDFTENLRIRRMGIKNMYNSLLGSREDIHAEALNLLEGKMSDTELMGCLSFRNVADPEKTLRDIKGIREHIASFRTLNERTIVRRVMPPLMEDAFASESPDRAIAAIEKLLTQYGIKTAHLRALTEQKELMKGIVKITALSPYLTKIFLSDHFYLNTLIEEWSIVKSFKEETERIERALHDEDDIAPVLARFRRMEEVRLGMLYLLGILKLEDLFRGLSQLAEAILRAVVSHLGNDRLSVIALGKLGGREMTFGSDLDIIFVSESSTAMKTAESVMKILTSYTDLGPLYTVDTRLRPEGSRGILVNDVEGYRNYYLEKAQKWEIQALLKARPVGGNDELSRLFVDMARDIILQKCSTITKQDISSMRQRIVNELCNSDRGIDVKLAPGGIEEIEFFIQYLQLLHAKSYPDILVQNTVLAIERLSKRGILAEDDRKTLITSYYYFRNLSTFLRLNEAQMIDEGSSLIPLFAGFLGHRGSDEFLSHVSKMREDVLSVVYRN